MSSIVPTVSTSGWVSAVAEKADRLLSYYFISDFSQSNLYRGQIMSLPYHVQQAGHDELELQRLIKGALEVYFRNHFDEAQVDVTTDKPLPLDPNRINITVGVLVVDNGQQFSLSKLIHTVQGKILEIIDINNYKGA